MKYFLILIFVLFMPFGFLFGEAKVTASPSGYKALKAVRPFDVKKYMGRWYEVARIDFFFEKGLSNVTATYSLDKDGHVVVYNRGYKEKKGLWTQTQGKAKFATKDHKVGELKVSFFGPFYSPYRIFYLSPGYSYAFVAGGNPKLLWLLSRKPSVTPAVKQEFLRQAKLYGFDTKKILFINHDKVSLPKQIKTK